ncbi:hypothetical protein ACROYT_G014765 [Oculina patagonica]
MPSKKHYGYNQMKTEDRQKFLQWYDDRVNENYVFDFKKEIVEYCRSDVDILRRCMLKFRQDFINEENIDPLKYITIAGVCMAIYRGNYMPKNTIAVVDNVVQTENHSAVSIAWLDYIAEKNNIKIQHALEGGEKVINNKLKVDGFCESTNTVYEFQGCFWHGCPDCYKPDVINNKNQCDMGTLYNKTKAKNNKITSAGYNLIEMWECKLKKDKIFQKYYKNDLNREVVGPLNPRDGFFGGRTNASKLLYNFKDGEYGKYVDFCSLYPTVQFYKKYPIGHPEKIISPEKYDKKWYGFIKCKILAPRELYHPVLPQKIKCENSEKLMFPLCISCAKSKQQERCQHSENERSFIGTWTTDEVNKAIEKGRNRQYISITSTRLTESEIFDALLDAYVCLNEAFPPNYSSLKITKKISNPRIRNPCRIPLDWRSPKTPVGLRNNGPTNEADGDKEFPETPRCGVPVKLCGGGEHNVIIDPQSLNLEKIFFDKGSTSRLYRGTFTDLSGQCKTVCAKEFLVSLRGPYKSKVKKEVEKIATLKHPNILINYGIDFDRSILVTEYMEKIIQYDDSEECIHNTRELLDIKTEGVPWSLRIRIAVQAAEGLRYLHSQGIIHADIKAGNVFLSGGRDEENWLVKLGDFGKSLFEFLQYSITQASCLPQDSSSGNETRRVTKAFLAPERADPKQKPTKASDIYAFSMFLVELTCPERIHPFESELPPDSDVFNFACSGARPTMPQNINDLNSNIYKLLTDVVFKAWSLNPETRPDSQELLILLKELSTFADPTFLKSNKDNEIDCALAQYGVPDELVSLECHQGTAADVLTELVADSLNRTRNVTPQFQSTIDTALRSSDGTNACVFLSVLILDRLKSVVYDSNIDT